MLLAFLYSDATGPSDLASKARRLHTVSFQFVKGFCRYIILKAKAQTFLSFFISMFTFRSFGGWVA